MKLINSPERVPFLHAKESEYFYHVLASQRGIQLHTQATFQPEFVLFKNILHHCKNNWLCNNMGSFIN